LKEKIERKRTGDYPTKPPHGQSRAAKEDPSTESWLWLRKGVTVLKKETKGLITAAQSRPGVKKQQYKKEK